MAACPFVDDCAKSEPCAVCGRSGGVQPCGGCGAIEMCGRCVSSAHHPPAECARLRGWMMDDEETNPPTPSSCSILSEAGLHGHGLWVRACAPPGDPGRAPWGSLAPPFPSCSGLMAPLPDLARLLGLPVAPDLSVLANSVDAAGPAGLLLHRPATAAMAVERALAQPPSSPSVFTLALLGVRAEADAWPTLLYIPCLLPASSAPAFAEFHIACVSPDVPAGLDGRSAVFPGPAGGTAETTRLSFRRGRWHDDDGRPRPDAVAALDAGLAATPGDWLPTLQALLDDGGPSPPSPPPILITDLHAAAATAAVEVARGGLGPGGVAVSEPVRNPHRRRVPSRRVPGGLRLPAHECGWAFWIEKSVAR